MRLFKCELVCKIKGMPPRTEYLRAKNDDVLTAMFEQCEKIEGSTYYGYKWVAVCVMKMSDFPQIQTITVGKK